MPRPPEVERQQERFNDNLLQSSFSYWSAILTVNGIILAFFSADILKEEFALDWLIIILLFLCLISISLILINFRSIKDLYFTLGSTNIDQFRAMSDQEREDYKNKGLKKHKWKNIRETTIEGLLFIEGFIILFLVVYSKYLLC